YAYGETPREERLPSQRYRHTSSERSGARARRVALRSAAQKITKRGADADRIRAARSETPAPARERRREGASWFLASGARRKPAATSSAAARGTHRLERCRTEPRRSRRSPPTTSSWPSWRCTGPTGP